MADEIIATIEAKSTELTKSRKGMLSERKKALNGVEKLHNYTKCNDYKSLNGEGKQINDVDISRDNNNLIVTAGENNSVSILRVSTHLEKNFLVGVNSNYEVNIKNDYFF